MNETLKNKVIDFMIKENLVDKWEEIIKTDTDIQTDVAENIDESDVGITSDGIKYSKSTVINYLNEKGYQLNQTNMELAAKMISETDGKLTISSNKIVKHHDLENASVDDLNTYINYKILEQIAQIKMELLEDSFKEYAVEILYDQSGGGMDVGRMETILEKYSSKGWKVKSIFTNEVGKNSSAVSTVVGTIGVNSTLDQTIIVFERSRFLSDKDFSNLMSKLKK